MPTRKPYSPIQGLPYGRGEVLVRIAGKTTAQIKYTGEAESVGRSLSDEVSYAEVTVHIGWLKLSNPRPGGRDEMVPQTGPSRLPRPECLTDTPLQLDDPPL